VAKPPRRLDVLQRGEALRGDLVGYFYAVVEEWKARVHKNNISLADVEPLLAKVEEALGTSITHVHEVEYRCVLILKEPCYYLRVFPLEEVAEVLETEPTPIPGVNTWIFQIYGQYKRFVDRVKRGRRTAPLYFRDVTKCFLLLELIDPRRCVLCTWGGVSGLSTLAALLKIALELFNELLPLPYQPPYVRLG